MNLRARAQLSVCRGLDISLPYVEMGNVDSLDLFAPKELELLAFYETRKYRKVADIGANLGLHSMCMANLGWHVTAYEPDPQIYTLMCQNVEGYNVNPVNAAVSDHAGEGVFTQVLNNRTGSHLKGVKAPYGPLTEVQVQIVDAKDALADVEFVKIDAEGSEWAILSRMPDGVEAISEVTNAEIAARIFDRFPRIYAQHLGWDRVVSRDQMPTKHQDGAVFITHAAWL